MPDASATPRKPFLIGVDSDGCVFDTMEIKQKGCFTRNTVKYFGLQSVFRAVCECSEFVNLYSRYRGQNRFLALLKVFELLSEHPQVDARGMALPDLEPLRAWVAGETQLGNAALAARVQKEKHPTMATVLEWSLAINRDIADLVRGVGPFPNAENALRSAREVADLVVVSQTPREALEREWEEHHLQHLVRTIYGQEDGTKDQHLVDAADGHYAPHHVLMLGDALGDLDAARKAGVLFFPIVPGEEENSWKLFQEEALERFVSSTYFGAYADALLEQFLETLPATPPWAASGNMT